MKTKHDPNQRELVASGIIRRGVFVKLAVSPLFKRVRR
jgi:hypothetical protein